MRLGGLLATLVAAFAGLALGLALTALFGENPFHVAQILWLSAFGSWYDFGATLSFATPLLFTGLSVSLAYRAKLFNVGAEGQMLAGAMAVAAVGIKAPELPLGLVWGIAAAAIAGAGWGGIAGLLKTKRGSHEVITTLMLNFIAAGMTSLVCVEILKDPASQNPETLPVGAAFRFAKLTLFDDAPVHHALTLAVCLSLVLYIVFNFTGAGYALRAVGLNPAAARGGGLDVARIQLGAMAGAGALAGLAGAAEVMGQAGRLRLDFSPGYGFTGIAVALLARANPIGAIFSALLFGALHKGGIDLDFETNTVTQELSMVIQAMVIIAMAMPFGERWRPAWKRV